MTTHDFGNGPVPAHRHPNGGGWVADTAHVDESAYVGRRAWVYGKAWVYGEAQVSGEAWVCESPPDPGPDPDLPSRVKAAIMEAPDKRLNMAAWHTCETTHCLAGWAVHLHPDGYAMEQSMGTRHAAEKLWPEAAPHFLDTDEKALRWLREEVR